ncbi:MAG: chitobiase/beta-hexosaminidase C-terminal domain-containing protein, partial [Lachnospiraceae bacterium]|nr:chitobiase/beta-hexosaminidase C-terminal domain-containing protein [Lachnospiraceae bacterium]
QQYMAMTPEFSYEAGSYEKVIPLKISANTSGTIYYTLDGSEPDEHSTVYTAPIFLESGEYQVGAVFINDYGIKSSVARNWYMINLTVPDQPELLLYSGEYNVPTMIEVAMPEEGTVYYTTDGSNPTGDSLVYTGPIEMPLGKSNFKFVTISDEGVSSQVVSRSFDFDLKTDVSTQQAIVNVISALYNRGVLRDLQGHSFEIEGRYVFEYDTIVEIPNLGYYYVLNEFVEEPNGNKVRTERLYAVEVYSGAANRLTYDANGQMGLIPLD